MCKIAALIFPETRKSYFPLLRFFHNVFSVSKQFHLNIILTVELTKYPYHHKRYSLRKKDFKQCLGMGRK